MIEPGVAKPTAPRLGVRAVSGALLALVVLTCSASRIHAQVLDAEWTNDTEKRINEHRKTPLRVIVLDREGEPVSDTQVHIKQLSHAFTIGFLAPSSGWPEHYDAEARGWRVFNAVSLDRLSNWPALQPDKAMQWRSDALDAVIRRARAQNMALRWGGVISADLGRNAPWVGALKGEKLRDAMLRYTRRFVIRRYADRVRSFDLYTDWLDHDLAGRGLATPFVRALYQQTRADTPQATLAARFEQSLIGDGQHAMFEKARTMREAFIRYDRVAIDHVFQRRWSHDALRKALDDLETMEAPVVLTAMQVAEQSEAEAAITMELVLRQAFAEPALDGIYFDGLRPSSAVDAEAALFDETGRATKVGQIVDAMFREHWRTNERSTTGPLGNVKTRAFAGRYLIAATIDGQSHVTRVWLPAQREQRIVVVQPSVTGKNETRK